MEFMNKKTDEFSINSTFAYEGNRKSVFMILRPSNICFYYFIYNTSSFIAYTVILNLQFFRRKMCLNLLTSYVNKIWKQKIKLHFHLICFLLSWVTYILFLFYFEQWLKKLTHWYFIDLWFPCQIWNLWFNIMGLTFNFLSLL